MLDDAKTITLNQGNGNTASVTLYANDTLDEVAKKLNDAVANGLGQAKYVDDATKFVTFTGNGATTDSESVNGTFVIRSVVPGKSGEITLSGDEAVLNAFSLNTIQKSKETAFNVDVQDAHTGEMIAQNVKVTGNVAHGLIDENVDVEFSELAGINARWNNNLNKFVYSASTEETTLHLADNTTVLQIGANEGEDLAMNIGDMRSHALGLDGVNVMSHDRAARSITIIDNAIDKVSTQRANLGAYQNRLEYTASNLTTASENLTSAESRIRDTDMAKEMMNFTKLNIMLQAGNSMLAQANQQPQNVLSLIR
jgi:flagellin